jgi:hypothetical protein
MMRNCHSCLLAILIVCAVGGGQIRVHAEVTFSKDIAPIIFEKCTTCHRPGEAAPFALQSYADVKKRGELIARVVEQLLMPPWKAGHGDVAFRGNRQLSRDQIQLIKRWVSDDMPEGNPQELPPLPEFTPGWALGEPDLVVSMKEAYRVPADGPDIYRNFVIPLGLNSDHWVTAIDFRPRVRSVVHHSLFYFETTGRARQFEDEDSQPGFKGGIGVMMRLGGGPAGMMVEQSTEPFEGQSEPRKGGKPSEKGSPTIGTLGGWALGTQPHHLPDGLAYRLPAGSDLILATHFHPSGKEEDEVSVVGLYFAKVPTTRRFTSIQLPAAFGAFKNIDIPPGAKEYVIEDSFVLPIDVAAFGVAAHAHYLGKSMTLTAALPNGETRILLTIPDWDFAWQEQYQFADYVLLPKGTRLHSRITYDNSAENPRNPTSPPGRVRFGEETRDEMGSITLGVVADKEADLPQLLEAFRNHVQSSLMKAPLHKLLPGRLRSKD